MTTFGQVQQEQMIINDKTDVIKPKPKQKYKFSEYLVVGTYIDAQDSINTWCVGRIVDDYQSDAIKVNYEGWHHKWNEVSTFLIFVLFSCFDRVVLILHLLIIFKWLVYPLMTNLYPNFSGSEALHQRLLHFESTLKVIKTI